MEKRILWVLVVALLAVDILLIFQRAQSAESLRHLRRSATKAMLESEYAEEEQRIVTGGSSLQLEALLEDEVTAESDRVAFLLLGSVDDCTNCIEDEIVKLNEVLLQKSGEVVSILGYFVDEDRRTQAERFIANLTPPPRFRFEVRDLLVDLPGATTPLVLVVRAQDGRILDAHKPIPEALGKRDAFYRRWIQILELD